MKIQLSGDQSAALRSIACVLASRDPQAALDTAAGVRRPSDAARAMGVVVRNLAATDRERARQIANTAGRLLLRVPNPDHRLAEQRLLLAEIAVLGEEAVAAIPELPLEETRLALVLGRMRSDPSAALELMRGWELTGAAADRSLAAAAPRLAATEPERAVEVAAAIGSGRLRSQAVWVISERRPAEEVVGLAQWVSDEVVRSAMLASAAARAAASDPDTALGYVSAILVAPDSAQAEVAVGLAESDPERAIELTSGLPEPARRWALGRIAVALAGREPERARALLTEIGSHPEIVRLVVGEMAKADAELAIEVVDELLTGESREAALVGIVEALAKSEAAQRMATDLVWAMKSARWRAAAVGALAPRLAETDGDAATSLIGLLADPGQAQRLRSEVAVRVAARRPETAARLLGSLPPSDYRSDAALRAAAEILSSGGGLEDGLRLAEIGMTRDLALRWLVPMLARSRAGSPSAAAEDIESHYLRTLGLVDAARELLGGWAKCHPVPERARQVRPIVEWEGM